MSCLISGAVCLSPRSSLARGPMLQGSTAAQARRRRMGGFGRLSLGLVLLVILSEVAPQPCPAQCSCSGSTVDCHGLALRSVPRNIPRNTERL